METKTFKANVAFIEHVPNFGMVVGNEGENADIPVDRIDDFTKRGLIGKAAKSSKPAPADLTEAETVDADEAPPA